MPLIHSCVFRFNNTFCFTGIITLQTDFQICKEGDTLTPEQARLLVRILIKMQLSVISLLDIQSICYLSK